MCFSCNGVYSVIFYGLYPEENKTNSDLGGHKLTVQAQFNILRIYMGITPLVAGVFCLVSELPDFGHSLKMVLVLPGASSF